MIMNSSTNIPTDVWDTISSYLKPVDLISFTLSRTFSTFPLIFQLSKYRKWNLSNIFQLEPSSCVDIFSSQCFSDFQTVITSLDLSHVSWFDCNQLLTILHNLQNLENLFVLNTALTISKIPPVFATCPLIKTLEVSLNESNWLEFQEAMESDVSLELLKSGFSKLSTFKIQWNISENSGVESFYLLLKLLGFLKECVDLELRVSNSSFSANTPVRYSMRKKLEDFILYNKKIEGETWNDLTSGLKWMVSLHKFVISIHGQSLVLIDYCLDALSSYIAEKIKPLNLKEWFLPLENCTIPLPQILSRNLTRVCLDGQISLYETTEADLMQITHLSHVKFEDVCFYPLPNLRFLIGTCYSSALELVALCQRNAQLEHLIVFSAGPNGFDHDIKTWSLDHLKTFAYVAPPIYFYPSYLRILKVCPNLEFLEIYRVDDTEPRFDELASTDINTIHELKMLKRLTLKFIYFSDVTVWLKVFEECKLLENLEIITCRPEFINDLSSFFHQAYNMRHLKLEINNECSFLVLVKILNSISCLPMLERIILIAEWPSDDVWVEEKSVLSQIVDTLEIILTNSSKLFALSIIHRNQTRFDDEEEEEAMEEEATDRMYEYIKKRWKTDRPDLWRLASFKLFTGHGERSWPQTVSDEPRRTNYDQSVNPFKPHYNLFYSFDYYKY